MSFIEVHCCIILIWSIEYYRRFLNCSTSTFSLWYFTYWCYWCDCWCVSRCCWCSIRIFCLYCRWIWCSYEVFSWFECYFSWFWINCVLTNFFSIFIFCWNFFFCYRVPIYYELRWLLICNCDWHFAISWCKCWCTFLSFTLDSYWFCRCSFWCYSSYCWCVSRYCWCSIRIFCLYCHWIWCSCEVFVWFECYFSSFWIDCILTNFFFIFCRWNFCFCNWFFCNRVVECRWLSFINLHWYFVITRCECWCTFLSLTLDSCWFYRCSCWCYSSEFRCVSCFRYSTVCIFRLYCYWLNFSNICFVCWREFHFTCWYSISIFH